MKRKEGQAFIKKHLGIVYFPMSLERLSVFSFIIIIIIY